jgi:hypothetical protein
MDPISPRAQHILRLSGVHEQVLKELEKHNILQAHSEVLFQGSAVNMFIGTNPEDRNKGTVEFTASQERPLFFLKGYLRSLHHALTGKEPESIQTMVRSPEPSGDLFKYPIVQRYN